MASRIALKPCSLGRPSLAGSGRCGRTQSHSSSDRSVGYLVISMAQSVGHHHVWAQFPDSLWKGNSRKFGVASVPPSSAASALGRHGGTILGSNRTYQVAFVAPLCIKRLRLATLQLPENFSPIGPEQSRTSR